MENASEARHEDTGGPPRRAERAGRPSSRSADPGQVILLVEDNETDQELYGHLLWYNGYTVLRAVDGETAIELALEARPDLILLDVVLEGELTGLDVARRLREEGLDVPMVALSAKPRDEFGSAVEEAGITGYLQKPVDPFVVVKEVLRRVGGSQPRVPRIIPEPGVPEPGVGDSGVGDPGVAEPGV